jgi:DNA-binding NarL/FixJ family response regulator
MRGRWVQFNTQERGVLRSVIASGVRVVVVELGSSIAEMLDLVSRLSGYLRPIVCVVVDAAAGPDREIAARQAGAAAYVPASSGMEGIEAVVAQLLGPGAPSVMAAGTTIASGLKRGQEERHQDRATPRRGA